MAIYDNQTEAVPFELPNGTIINVEVTQKGREDVSHSVLPFKQITDAIEGIAEAITTTVEKVKHNKTAVKFGLEVSLESGNLTALIVKGSGKGNLEITLEWDNQLRS